MVTHVLAVRLERAARARHWRGRDRLFAARAFATQRGGAMWWLVVAVILTPSLERSSRTLVPRDRGSRRRRRIASRVAASADVVRAVRGLVVAVILAPVLERQVIGTHNGSRWARGWRWLHTLRMAATAERAGTVWRLVVTRCLTPRLILTRGAHHWKSGRKFTRDAITADSVWAVWRVMVAVEFAPGTEPSVGADDWSFVRDVGGGGIIGHTVATLGLWAVRWVVVAIAFAPGVKRGAGARHRAAKVG